MGLDTSAISCCFDEECQEMLDDYLEEGLGSTSASLLSSLKSRGLAGSSVLELGCGVGGLTIEMVKNGASSAVGLDLSPKMVAAARTLASDRGVTSIDFRQGDGATADLPQSDIVVLDTVICCYPDVENLVANTSAAARRLYAISIPDDRRWATKFLKTFLPLQRVLLRRRGAFRMFVHPTGTIIGRLRSRGFTLVSEEKADRIWGVMVFAAPQGA